MHQREFSMCRAETNTHASTVEYCECVFETDAESAHDLRLSLTLLDILVLREVCVSQPDEWATNTSGRRGRSPGV
jgi:hypothetical protein